MSPALALGLLLAIALAGFAQPSPAPAARASSNPSVQGVISLILHRNQGLSSYQAHAHLDIRQVNFPWLHPVLDGTAYYESPGFTVLDFPHAPRYLRGVTKVEGVVYEATRWQKCYDISMSSEPDAYVLHMTPKIHGEIWYVDVTVGKGGGELQHIDWYYHNPGDSIHLTQYYSIVNGYSVVTLQESEITLHHIRAKGRGAFYGFTYNVPVPTPTPTPSDPLHQCDN